MGNEPQRQTFAVISISSNMAEGFERDSVRDEIRYLVIAKGSAAELRSQVAAGWRLA